MEVTTNSPQQTEKIAYKFAKFLKSGDIVALHGELGAGKTVFTKGLVAGLGITAKVTSPTFIFCKTYRGKTKIVNHIDLYRAKVISDLGNLGLDEILSKDSITIIEWPERLGSKLPKDRVDVFINVKDENTRIIKITKKSGSNS